MMEREDSITFITRGREGRSIWCANPAGPAAVRQHLHRSRHAAGPAPSPRAGYQRWHQHCSGLGGSGHPHPHCAHCKDLFTQGKPRKWSPLNSVPDAHTETTYCQGMYFSSLSCCVFCDHLLNIL